MKPKKISRQRKYQIRNNKAGLCSICDSPLADGSKTLCEEHRAENRERSRRTQREKAGIPLDHPRYKRFNKNA